MQQYRASLVPLVEAWRRDRRRVAVFGTGSHTDLLFRAVPELATLDIVGFLDNDEGKQGSRCRGITIHPPGWASGHADVILCSSFVNERAMAASVAGLGCVVALSHGDAPPVPVPAAAMHHRRDVRRRSLRGADLRTQAPTSAPVVEPGCFDVLVLPIIDWHFRLQRPQQLALQLAARGHRVFYVRNTFRSGARAGVRLLEDRVFEVTLPAPQPVDLYTKPLDAAVVNAFASSLRQLTATHGLLDVVCLVGLPVWWPLAARMRGELGWKVVYDCMDDHRSFSHTGAAMLAAEDPLVRGGDLVVASSAPLAARARASSDRVELIPNGVDYAHFAYPLAPVPAALAGLPRPLIGYYGAISEWFDSSLVARLAAARPAWSFVLVGGTPGADLAPLAGLANVHRLPEQAYEQLPSVLDTFDVAVIPFKRTPLTDATNPVKLYEYWAAGKPVVATRLTELERLGAHVQLAATDDEWIAALESAAADNDPAGSAERRSLSAGNTWEARAEALGDSCRALFPLVSVVLVEGSDPTLSDLCLSSVLRSRYPALDVIVVAGPDRSTRRSPSPAPRPGHQLRRVSVPGEAAFPAALTLGVTQARGAHLVLLAAESILAPDAVSRFVQHLLGPAAGVVTAAECAASVALTRSTLKGVGAFRGTDPASVFADYARRACSAGLVPVLANDVAVSWLGRPRDRGKHRPTRAGRQAKPLASVVMPFYNNAPHLAAALRSYLGQTVEDIEIVLVDDGSTDGSHDIAAGFADRRIVLTRAPSNEGISPAYNRGLALARADIVCFAGADDVADPERVEAMLAACDGTTGPAVVASDVTVIDGDGGPTGAVYGFPDHVTARNVLLETLKRNYFLGAAMAVCGAPALRLDPALPAGDDFDVALRLLVDGAAWRHVGRPLVRYRIHDGNYSRHHGRMKQGAQAALRRHYPDRLESALAARGHGACEVSLALGIVALFLDEVSDADRWLYASPGDADDSARARFERLFYQGVLRFRQGRCRESFVALTAALDVFPDDPACGNNVAALEAMLNGNLHEARACLLRVTERHAGYVDARRNIQALDEGGEPRMTFTERLLPPVLLHGAGYRLDAVAARR